MDEQAVFAFLKKQEKTVLLDYLHAAFQEMDADQRRAVFGEVDRKPVKAPSGGDELREEIDEFRRDSLARSYYAPFNMNSKNFMHIPERTREWCSLFARFVADASTLTARGEHTQAAACFAMLYELLEALDQGEEIIFADFLPSSYPSEEKKTGGPKKTRKGPKCRDSTRRPRATERSSRSSRDSVDASFVPKWGSGLNCLRSV